MSYFVFSLQLRRLQSTLVVAEHNNETLSAVTQNTLSAAKKIGGDVSVLVAGTKCGPVSLVAMRNTPSPIGHLETLTPGFGRLSA